MHLTRNHHNYRKHQMYTPGREKKNVTTMQKERNNDAKRTAGKIYRTRWKRLERQEPMWGREGKRRNAQMRKRNVQAGDYGREEYD